MTVYEAIYGIITGYILPEGLNFPYYGYILVGLAALASVGVFWACFVRPFNWFIKYGLFGGSKRNPLTRRRRKQEDDE